MNEAYRAMEDAIEAANVDWNTRFCFGVVILCLCYYAFQVVRYFW